VLGTPPALILSQDQTLNWNLIFKKIRRELTQKNLKRLILHSCQRAFV
jgi:hypothetical protein